jgi:hypothetical protein
MASKAKVLRSILGHIDAWLFGETPCPMRLSTSSEQVCPASQRQQFLLKQAERLLSMRYERIPELVSMEIFKDSKIGHKTVTSLMK